VDLILLDLIFFKKNFKKPLDKQPKVCYNNYRKLRKEVNKK